MTIKEFLYQVRREQREVDNLKDRIEQARMELTGLEGIDYSGDKVQTTPVDQLSARMVAYLDLSKALDELIQNLVRRHKAAYRVIQRLDDSNERQVLQMYFLDFGKVTMEDVAIKMNYSIDSCWKFYNKAFDHLDHMDAGVVIYKALQEITD